MAKNFDQMREQLLNDQREQVFQVFAETLAKQYEGRRWGAADEEGSCSGKHAVRPVVDSLRIGACSLPCVLPATPGGRRASFVYAQECIWWSGRSTLPWGEE